jgi:hypothetical protein
MRILFRAFANPRRVEFGAAPDDDEAPRNLSSSLADAPMGIVQREENDAREYPQGGRVPLSDALEAARGRIEWDLAPASETRTPRILPDVAGTETCQVEIPCDGGGTREAAFRRHDPRAASPSRIHMIVGGTDAERAALMRDLVASSPVAWACAAGMGSTPESHDLLRSIVPDSCVYDEHDRESLSRMIKAVRSLNHVGVYMPTMVIIDVCGGTGVLGSLAMRDLFMNGRHLRMDVYVLCHRVPVVPRAMTAQIDYVYALWEPRDELWFPLYGNFLHHVFGTYDRCDRVLAALADASGGGCLVVDGAARSDGAAENRIFWYRARRHLRPEESIAGSHEQWSLHYIHYRRSPCYLGDAIPALAHMAARRDAP